MTACQRTTATLAAVLAFSMAGAAMAQTTTEIVTENGIQYQVTKQLVPRQVAVPETQPQQQTTYRQQVTTESVAHQQNYIVPVTQYQLVSELHGRWNPFVTPYWTQKYVPVTTWQQQTATVQIPVSKVAWAPETKTVNATVMKYQTVNEEYVSRRVIGPAPMSPGVPGGTTAIADARPLSQAAQPSATLRAAGGGTAVASAAPIGGQRMTNDPPKEATGWQQPPSRYDTTNRR